jgi:hypothetical protein
VDLRAISVAAVGTTVATSTTHNGSAALPTTADGKNPKVVQVSVNSGVVYVKFGVTGVTATTNDALVNSSAPVLFNVVGMGFYDVIADTGTPKVNIVPIES